MADRSPYRDTDDESTGRLPRWVWVTGIIVAVVVLAVIAIMLIGGGGHDPSRFDHF